MPVVKQITNNVTDPAHDIAALTSARLLTADGGILPGPRAKLEKRQSAKAGVPVPLMIFSGLFLARLTSGRWCFQPAITQSIDFIYFNLH